MPLRTDNRLTGRIEGLFAVRYSPQGSNGEFYTNTIDISKDGMKIPLLKKLGPGTILDLEIFNSNRNIKIRCRGKIAWVWEDPLEDKGIYECFAGIQLLGGSDNYIDELNKILAS